MDTFLGTAPNCPLCRLVGWGWGVREGGVPWIGPVPVTSEETSPLCGLSHPICIMRWEDKNDHQGALHLKLVLIAEFEAFSFPGMERGIPESSMEDSFWSWVSGTGCRWLVAKHGLFAHLCKTNKPTRSGTSFWARGMSVLRLGRNQNLQEAQPLRFLHPGLPPSSPGTGQLEQLNKDTRHVLLDCLGRGLNSIIVPMSPLTRNTPSPILLKEKRQDSRKQCKWVLTLEPQSHGSSLPSKPCSLTLSFWAPGWLIPDSDHRDCKRHPGSQP